MDFTALKIHALTISNSLTISDPDFPYETGIYLISLVVSVPREILSRDPTFEIDFFFN